MNTTLQLMQELCFSQINNPALELKATDDKKVLLQRIKRMIEKKEKNFFNYRHQLLALFVMTVVFSSLALLSPADNKPAANAPQTVKPITVQPLAASVENPLFNPVFFLAKEENQQRKLKLKAAIETPAKVVSVTSLPIEAHVEKVEAEESGTSVAVEKETNVKQISIEQINLPVIEGVFENQLKAASPLIFQAGSIAMTRLKEPVTRVFTKMRPAVPSQKAKLEKQKAVKEIQVALEKVRTAKKLLELSVIDNLVSRGAEIQTRVLIDFTRPQLMTQQELDLAEQRLEQQLYEQMHELEEVNVAYASYNTAVENTQETPKVYAPYTTSDDYGASANGSARSQAPLNASKSAENADDEIEVILTDAENELRELIEVSPAKQKAASKDKTKPKKKIYTIRI
jgi:hypothetical protein